MRVTNATWDDVFIFGTALLFTILVFAIFKLIIVASYSSERKAIKYGSPRDFIGSYFIDLTKSNFEMFGENYTDTSWKFSLLKHGKNGYAFNIEIVYQAKDIKTTIEFKSDNAKEIIQFLSPYDEKIVQDQILKTFDTLRASRTVYTRLSNLQSGRTYL